jgi:hypothetical protein
MEPNWVAPFLQALASGCTVSEAATHAGVTSSAAYNRRSSDDDFRAAWEQALEDSADILESVARRRAIDGVEEPVVYQGQLTPVWERDEVGNIVMDERIVVVKSKDKDGNEIEREVAQEFPRQARNRDGSLKWLTIRKPSDSLLALLLKGRRKNVFSDRTELAGVPGAPIVVDETVRAARIAALLAAAKDRSDMV